MRRALIAILSCALLLTACRDAGNKVSVQPAPAPEPPTEAALQSAAEGFNTFALDLHRHLPVGGNLFYSPAGIRSTLALAWSGADGRTEQEMQDVLHLGESRNEILAALGSLHVLLQQTEGPATLSMANRLWGQEGFPFREEWTRSSRRHFAGGFESADFRQDADAERLRINRWVAKNTGDRITDLLPPGAVNASTRLALTNAVHFLAPWQHPFKKTATQDRDFHTPDGSIKVPTMSASENFWLFQDKAMTLLGLPYEKGEYEFVVILPHIRDGLPVL